MNSINGPEIQESYRNYCARKELYKKYGYDMEKERGFIVDKAQPLQGKLLEVGTGKGHLAIELARKGYYFDSVDSDKENLRIAELNLKCLRFENCVKLALENAEHLSFKDTSFDAALMVNVLHHLQNPYQVLRELIRVVSLNGKIVISDFTEEGFSVMDKIHASEGTCHEKGKVSLGEIENFLLSKGFRTERFTSRFQEIIVIRFGVLFSFDLFA